MPARHKNAQWNFRDGTSATKLPRRNFLDGTSWQIATALTIKWQSYRRQATPPISPHYSSGARICTLYPARNAPTGRKFPHFRIFFHSSREGLSATGPAADQGWGFWRTPPGRRNNGAVIGIVVDKFWSADMRAGNIIVVAVVSVRRRCADAIRAKGQVAAAKSGRLPAKYRRRSGCQRNHQQRSAFGRAGRGYRRDLPAIRRRSRMAAPPVDSGCMPGPPPNIPGGDPDIQPRRQTGPSAHGGGRRMNARVPNGLNVPSEETTPCPLTELCPDRQSK
jgi:hypothetical protein